MANQQVLGRELIAEFDHPDIGRVRQPKPAARFDRTPAAIQGPAPRIGEHSAVILAELGLAAPEIKRLAAEKIVRLVETCPGRSCAGQRALLPPRPWFVHCSVLSEIQN